MQGYGQALTVRPHQEQLNGSLRHCNRSAELERVYKFSRREQISIFQSAPRPMGAENTDHGYSPLWRLVLVTRKTSAPLEDLKSEEDLLSAEEKGQLCLADTDIVVNGPITRDVGGEGLAGVR